MSKGSNRRPARVKDEEVADNWNRIFGQTKIRTSVQDKAMEAAKTKPAKERPSL